MKIINTNSDKEKEIKMVPEMLNLLGCNKDNFKKLINIMNYKIREENNDLFFKYSPKKNKKKFIKKNTKESPFRILKKLNFK